MRLRLHFTALLLCHALLAGCATTARQAPPHEVDATRPEPVMPYKAPVSKVTELDSEIVFNTLAGEIALQRGQLDTAYQHQIRTAVIAEDAVAAERAARIAMLLKKDDNALDGVSRWVGLAPNDLDGRQLAELLFFRAGNYDQALRQMEAIVAISNSRGEDGFIGAVLVLSKEQDRNRVMQLLRRFADGHRDDPRAGYALALMSLIWKDYPRAEQDIREVLARRPDWNKGYILLSRIRKAQGDNEGALEILHEAVQRDRRDLDANIALAKLLVEMDDFEGGYAQFRRVHRLAPENADSNYALGVLALQLDRQEEARKYFEQLFESGSRKDDAAYYLGRIEEGADNPERAIRWYEEVSRGDYHFDSQIRIAQVMASQGRVQEARHWVQNLRIQMNDHSIELYLLEASILKGHATTREVLALYGKALEAHPDNDDLLYARGLFAAEIDRMDILERDLRRVIEQNPDNADALNALGYTYADRSIRFDEALRLISQALALKPDSPAILDSMGWLQYRLGNYDQALAYLQRAFDLMPDAEIAAHFGEVLWITGDKGRARVVWQQILRKEPDNRYVRETLKRLNASTLSR